MNDHLNTPYDAPASEFREVGGRTSAIAFFMGTAIITASIFLGRTFAFYIPFLVFSFVITLVWRKSPRPWIFLVSIAAATPIAIARQQYSCNLIFALCFLVFNMRSLSRLPRWTFLLTALATLGIFTSSLNWMGDNVIGSLMRQGSYALNFLLAPFILLPLIYVRMKDSRDHAANLQGLLYCLIVPSTVILLSAKLFGTVYNSWEASQHFQSLAEGFLQYKLGKVVVSFVRTEVGFILAALICASTAITVSQVKSCYKLLAGACLASNMFLLLSTGSFGSGFACLCGLGIIFYSQFRLVSMTKVFMSVAVICSILLLAYSFSPPNIKNYLGKRFEHRVVNKDTDRLTLWAGAWHYFMDHPMGVGFTLAAGDGAKAYIHNDYLAYMVSYSVMGGVAYTSLVVGLMISFIRRRKGIIDDPAALAVYLAGLGVIVAVAVNSITDNMLSSRWNFTLIWSLVWYSYFCSCAAQRETVTADITHNRNLGNRAGIVRPDSGTLLRKNSPGSRQQLVRSL